ncbi:hypothetical protein [Piscinibacter sp. HJYY11]|uniref:hypothetical protein n=1 Tax=Piscinibacter sp. HJYY11 TaxID=2801333 RepID=UPI00191F9D25|nr:hypothetical protein [Piscinibacter sp. HJYY11]MBL0729587.1 hypothetical protein [Piscinibacter sp. HJYY11]
MLLQFPPVLAQSSAAVCDTTFQRPDQSSRDDRAWKRTDYVVSIMEVRLDAFDPDNCAASNPLQQFLESHGAKETSFSGKRLYVGRLIEHGLGCFEEAHTEPNNYFVRLKTPVGIASIWSPDLRRAMNECGATLGDNIMLGYEGMVAVTRRTRRFDRHGKVASLQLDTTFRPTWIAKRLSAATVPGDRVAADATC